MRSHTHTFATCALAWLLAGVGWPVPALAQTTTETAVGQEPTSHDTGRRTTAEAGASKFSLRI